VAQKAVVADALETIGQYMQEEAANELLGVKRHRLLLAFVTIILVTEADLLVVNVQQAIVGNGHAVRIAAYIVQHLLGSGERAFGVDYPLRLASGSQIL